MIVIVSLTGAPVEHFADYNELFDCLTAIESLKLFAQCASSKIINWKFTIYPPKQVAAFYAYLKDTNAAIKEAYAESLSLIEICTSDYSKPTYIALTPNIDLDHLKRQWCIDYCTWHHLVVRGG